MRRRGPDAVIVAGVDCGTNTIKLLVAEVDPDSGSITELERCSRMVRLGQGVDATGQLSEAALGRAFAAVEEYAAIVEHHGAEAIRFCATSAARDADNAETFVLGVRRRLGVTPEVLSGAEEAALSFAGATLDLGSRPAPVLVVDIGGGSTELVLGREHGDVHAAASLDVGAVRLTERFLAGDPPREHEIAALVELVDAELDTLPARGVDLRRARSVVVVSGTGLTVAAGALGLETLRRDEVDRREVSVDAVRETIERLVAMPVSERAALGFVLRGREDVIGAGALILRQVLARTDVAQLCASVHDILDGITLSAASAGAGR